jgi:O-antigen/teichoic acid export membrane protein
MPLEPLMFQRIRAYLKKPGLGPQLVKATMGSAGLRVAGMLFGFLSGVQLARGLGAHGYGVYGLAMSVIALMAVVTEFGLPQLLTREVAAAQVHRQWGRVRGILMWSSRMVLLTSALTLVGVVGWMYFSGRVAGSQFGWTLLTGVLLVPLVAEGKIRSATLRGMQFIVRSQLPETLLRPALFSLLLFVVSWWLPLEPDLAMGLGVLSAAGSLLLSVFMLRASLPLEVRTATPEFEPKTWWSSAVPMAMTEGMRVFQGHLSVLLLGWFAAAASVGLFRVASSVAVLMAFPLTLFALVGAPLIARLHAQKEHERLQRMLSWLALVMTGSAVVMALPFLIAGGPLLGRVFGAEFSASNPILLVLCLNAGLTSFFGVNAVLLNMTGHQKRVTRASVISLAVAAVLSPLFIHQWGAVGAAWASTISMLVWNTTMWRDGVRLLSLDASFIPLIRGSLKKV